MFKYLVNSIRNNTYLRTNLDRLIKSSITYEKNSIGISINKSIFENESNNNNNNNIFD